MSDITKYIVLNDNDLFELKFVAQRTISQHYFKWGHGVKEPIDSPESMVA